MILEFPGNTKAPNEGIRALLYIDEEHVFLYSIPQPESSNSFQALEGSDYGLTQICLLSAKAVNSTVSVVAGIFS